jgi:hypothetical protein
VATLSGDLGDLIGQPLAFPNGQSGRAYLIPHQAVAIVGDELRIGSIQLTLDDDDAFSQANVPDGTYQVLVFYFDQAERRPDTWVTDVVVSGDTVLAV